MVRNCCISFFGKISRKTVFVLLWYPEMPFGTLAIGPPGSGKTTFCHGLSQFLKGLGRPTVLVNLDPANDSPQAVSVADAIKHRLPKKSQQGGGEETETGTEVANSRKPQPPSDKFIDVFDLIQVSDVMDAYDLGPNGALVYCMEYLEKNFDWLEKQLNAFPGM